MRIERTGKIEPLTPRVEKFLREGLKAKCLDDVQSPEQRRADYLCLKDILVIEFKTLEEDGSERVENLNDLLREREDYPSFYGKVPVESLLKNLGNPDEVRRKLTDRIGRAIISHLRKADKQFAAHGEQFPRKNHVRLVVLINEDHVLYEPEAVGFIVNRALHKMENNEPAYKHIDAVLFMTERHAQRINGLIAFPLLTLLGRNVDNAAWKEGFIQAFLERWSKWNGNLLFNKAADLKGFETIDHIDDKMPRHEMGRVEYRRKPYMQNWSDDQIKDAFDDSVTMSIFEMVKDVPVKPAKPAMMENMRRFTHILMELNRRGIPMGQMKHTLEKQLASAARLKLPQVAIEWLKALDAQKAQPDS